MTLTLVPIRGIGEIKPGDEIAERVAGALHDKRGCLQRCQMFRPELRRLAGRMKRVAEAEQPGDAAPPVGVVRDHARDATAHRLAADDKRRFRAQ